MHLSLKGDQSSVKSAVARIDGVLFTLANMKYWVKILCCREAKVLAKRFRFPVYCYVNRQECAKQAVSNLTKKMLCRQMNRKCNVARFLSWGMRLQSRSCDRARNSKIVTLYGNVWSIERLVTWSDCYFKTLKLNVYTRVLAQSLSILCSNRFVQKPFAGCNLHKNTRPF